MTSAETPQTPATGRAESVMRPPLRAVTLGLLASVGIIAFDGLGVTTALPRIASDLGGLSTYGWAVSALMLASVIGTVVAGTVADRGGPRTPYLGGLVVFAAGLVISATAMHWPIFLLGRIVQGLGMGAIMSMAYVAVAIVYPPVFQARALALLSGAWTVPSLIGPLLSSVLSEAASWRILFYALVPLVGVAGLVTVRGLPVPRTDSPADQPRAGRGVSHQLAFSVGLAVSTAVVLAGLEQQQSLPLLLAMVVIGGIVMLVSLRQVTPAGTLTARRGVPAGIATRAALSAAFFGVETFLPLAMTELRGARLTTAGLGIAAGAFVWVGGSMVQSRHEERRGACTRRADSVLGLLVLAVGIMIITVTVLSTTVPVFVAILGWVIGGFGMGLVYNASTTETFGETEPEAIGQMSGTIQMAQTLGTAVSAGVGTAILSGLHGADGSPAAGVGVVFALTISFALGAVPLALRIRRR